MERFEENVEIIKGSVILKEYGLSEKVRVHIQPDNETVTIFDGEGHQAFRLNSRRAVLDVGGNGVEGDIRVKSQSIAMARGLFFYLSGGVIATNSRHKCVPADAVYPRAQPQK